MKGILLPVFIFIFSICTYAQDQSKVFKYKSSMRIVENVKNRSDQKRYDEITIIVIDFNNNTIGVHPDQFKLDMLRKLDDTNYPDMGMSAVNLLCLSQNQKKCTCSIYYKGTKASMIIITFDDLEYTYSINQ